MTTPDCVLVTHKQLNLQRKNKFISTNVCQQFGVKWVDTFHVLDATRARQALLSCIKILYGLTHEQSLCLSTHRQSSSRYAVTTKTCIAA